MTPRSQVLTAVKAVMGYLGQHPEIVYQFAYKTLDYYGGRLDKYSRDYYNGKIDDTEFLDKMISVIETQLTRAWNEGMRDNGLDPKDMADEWRAELDNIITEEHNHVTDFADYINAQKESGKPAKDALETIYSRADLWQGRYTDTVNEARRITANKEDLYEWIYGDTDHCPECEALNGQVATMADWEASGYKPQSPPNEKISCGGWRCQCQLVLTEKKPTGEITV